MSEIDDLGDTGTPNFRDYGRTIWRFRWRIAIIALVFALLAGVYSAVQTPVYEATAQLRVSPTGNATDSQTAARNVDTEMAVLRSDPVQNAAEAKLGHEPDVAISNDGSNDVVSVTARSDDAKQAAEDANAYAGVYIALGRKQALDDLQKTAEQITAKIEVINTTIVGLPETSPTRATAQQQLIALQSQLDQVQIAETSSQIGPARLLARATTPDDPVSPKPVRNVAIALVLGLLLGVGIAFLRRYLGDTISTREELQAATDSIPVLAEIPRFRGDPLVVSAAPHTSAAEGYRTLRTSIDSLVVDRQLKFVQVTSAQTDDGKASVLANLAIALARSGVEVTIVCCDLRQPLIHLALGISDKSGYTSVVQGKTTVQDALQRVKDEPNLAVISTGPAVQNTSDFLSSDQLDYVLAAIKPRSSSPLSHLVLVDSPPVIPAVDALVVCRSVDATVVVATANATSRRALQRSVQMLRNNNAPLIGTVLTNAE